MTYDTLKLRHLPQVAESTDPATDVLDQLYEFDARANDDVDGKPGIDFFENRKATDAGWDHSKLLGLQRGILDPSKKTPYFPLSRYYVDDFGGLWTTNVALIESSGKAEEKLLKYERVDGTVMDDNPIDGGYYLAPEDIGRAFKNKTGNAEFTGFIDGIAKHYGPLFTKVLDALTKAKPSQNKNISGTEIGKVLANPDTSVKDFLGLIYTSTAIAANLADIEMLDLLHRYLVNGQALQTQDATVYKMPENSAAKDLKTLVPKGIKVKMPPVVAPAIMALAASTATPATVPMPSTSPVTPLVETPAATLMKDQYTFSSATTFTISGKELPSIKISHGGSDNILSIVRPSGVPIAFHIFACNPTDCTIIFSTTVPEGANPKTKTLFEIAKAARQAKLDDPDNATASEAEIAKYGIMPYDLDVVFKDGSKKRIKITATGI